ncbi:MobQ family relaxase [Paenibacillus alvei]|uniref:MobA/MobL family protein n=1 Tax=Paenibacillus alvei TaxID=44250 RepID=A0AAP7DLV9_PAEAL|nr:MobA/MobL family protein [Paenibacillus alvei]
MAIYHFSTQVASRSAGRSAVAMAAYRSGERLTDDRTGELKFYKRQRQPENVILAPAHSPEWVQNRNRLWNEVEKSEKRKDSQLCREINVALPVEFSPEQQKRILLDYCKKQFVDRGMIADIAIHRDDPNNPHAHIMLTMRDITPEGFGKKNREWNPDFAFGKVKNAERYVDWRAAWAEQVNAEFQRSNLPERIDHRSFVDQGITDRLPTVHEGPTVREMEQRGEITERGSLNRSVRAHNSMVVDLKAYAQERQKIQNELAANSKPKTIKQINEEHGRLYWQRNNMAGDISKLQLQLEKIQKVKELQSKHAQLRQRQEKLRPSNLWQRMTKPNQQQIDVLERDIQQLEQVIRVEQKGAPPPNEAPKIQKELSVLQGAFKAVDRAFREIDQERRQMQQAELVRKMREQAKLQESNPQRRQDRER